MCPVGFAEAHQFQPVQRTVFPVETVKEPPGILGLRSELNAPILRLDVVVHTRKNLVQAVHDRAIVRFCRYSGARIGSGTKLKVNDFQQDGDETMIRVHLKGGQERRRASTSPRLMRSKNRSKKPESKSHFSSFPNRDNSDPSARCRGSDRIRSRTPRPEAHHDHPRSTINGRGG